MVILISRYIVYEEQDSKFFCLLQKRQRATNVKRGSVREQLVEAGDTVELTRFIQSVRDKLPTAVLFLLPGE